MRPTLGQVFGAAVAAILLVVVLSFAVFRRQGERTALTTAESAHEAVARRVHEAVIDELARAMRALQVVEGGIRAGAIEVDDDDGLAADLYLRMLGDDHLEEATFTRATLEGYDAEGEAKIAPAGRRQISVTRAPGGELSTRITRSKDGRFQAVVRARPTDPAVPIGPCADPTEHATFTSLAAKRNSGLAIWSDLHFAERDGDLPVPERRVVLTVQKAIVDAHGTFVGVARVGLLTRALDDLPRRILNDRADPHTIALLSYSTSDPPHADLVARVDPSDRVVVKGNDVRIVSDRPPPAVAALLAAPLLDKLDPTAPHGDAILDVGGTPYLATVRGIHEQSGGTTGWFVAVMGPEAFYTQHVRELERSLIVGFALTLAVILAIGLVAIRALRRDLAKAVVATERMRAFDFAPAPARSRIRDIDEVVSGLERAKTVVRAMGKYVPVELVRRLFAANEEPTLGGKTEELTILFTDIAGFTTLAEKLAPDELALRLGDYLAAMTHAIEASGGTIDKYIGDAVMAFWNAPLPVAGHAERACGAVLAAQRALADLFASKAWEGLPPLVTRYGVHRALAMVGNFGAPTHLGYTALGDGVNVAARLEPLCKQYGVIALVSDDVVREAKNAFVFRRIDRVAVKGKTRGIDVYELLGAADEEITRLPLARRYEEAFDAYLARDFKGAIAILEPQADADPPSRVLLERCRLLAADPPGEGWSGVFVAKSK